VVSKHQPSVPAQQLAQLQLASGGGQDVYAPDHPVDLMSQIVCHHAQVIRELPRAVAQQ